MIVWFPMWVHALEVTLRAPFRSPSGRPVRPAIGHTARCAEPGVVIQAGRVHPVEVEWLLERFPKSSHRVGTDVVTQSVARLDAFEQKSPRAHSVKLNTGVTKAVVPGFPAGRPFAGRASSTWDAAAPHVAQSGVATR